ncbi:SUKH-3 domain-containing protein [Streptomyces camelliae]|uniref:SUKH-3 domain-containing protein n=1 Tax=Streptomyces camelliae TaxID=3004093 RepID=UPI003D16B407
MSSWSPEVDEVLEALGWTPGRKVDTARWRSMFEAVGLPMHDTAEAFLQEFGGLTVNVSGPGISCARTPFELDPAPWGQSRWLPPSVLDRGRRHGQKGQTVPLSMSCKIQPSWWSVRR